MHLLTARLQETSVLLHLINNFNIVPSLPGFLKQLRALFGIWSVLARCHWCPCLKENGLATLREETNYFYPDGDFIFKWLWEQQPVSITSFCTCLEASLGCHCRWLQEQQVNTLAQLVATISTGTCCLPLITVHSLWAWSAPSACAPCATDMETPCSSGPSSHTPLGATDQWNRFR